MQKRKPSQALGFRLRTANCYSGHRTRAVESPFDQEVAQLRKEMNALRRFITIETHPDTGEPRNMNLRCAVLVIEQPEVDKGIQMLFCASEEGPRMTLWDPHQKSRIVLSVEGGDPQVSLHTAEGKNAVLLRANPADGRGLVTVFDHGNPRALMKAGSDNAGVVSVVHDDGHSRVVLHGAESCGTIMVANPDLQTTVKICSETDIGGGQIVVSGPTGKASVILSHFHGLGGAVLTNGPDGQPSGSLPPAGLGEKTHEG